MRGKDNHSTLLDVSILRSVFAKWRSLEARARARKGQVIGFVLHACRAQPRQPILVRREILHSADFALGARCAFRDVNAQRAPGSWRDRQKWVRFARSHIASPRCAERVGGSAATSAHLPVDRCIWRLRVFETSGRATTRFPIPRGAALLDRQARSACHLAGLSLCQRVPEARTSSARSSGPVPAHRGGGHRHRRLVHHVSAPTALEIGSRPVKFANEDPEYVQVVFEALVERWHRLMKTAAGEAR